MDARCFGRGGTLLDAIKAGKEVGKGARGSQPEGSQTFSENGCFLKEFTCFL
jgi:hypothetical protein